MDEKVCKNNDASIEKDLLFIEQLAKLSVVFFRHENFFMKVLFKLKIINRYKTNSKLISDLFKTYHPDDIHNAIMHITIWLQLIGEEYNDTFKLKKQFKLKEEREIQDKKRDMKIIR